MTDKEATVYVIDIGTSMGKKHGDRHISDLDWSLVYIWDKMTSIVALERKTTYQAVIAFKSDRTNNDINSDGDYEHIDVLQEMKALQRKDLKDLQVQLVPSNTSDGDAIDAVVVAIDMISKHCKKLKYKRRIIMVTDGRGYVDSDKTDDIAEKLKEDGIELIILGIDFDDADYGFEEKNKSKDKTKNEALLKQLAESSDGIFGTLAQAIEELGQPRVKTTRPIASYKGMLSIGDPNGQIGNSVLIGVERYPKVMIRKPQSASTVRQSSDQKTQALATLQDGDAMDVDGEEDGKAIKSERRYFVEDPDEPGGRRDIEYDDLVRGYEYGRAIVPLSESEQNITMLETEQCLEILGFISNKEFPREMLMTTSHIIIGAKSDAKSTLALSSFVHALFELESFAVARFVAKKDKQPMIVLLAPLFEVRPDAPDYECLVELELPFAEDVRTYKFAPLDKILTVNGKEIKQHARLPDEDLQSAVNDYVDRMDLMTFGDDEEGKPAEYARIDEVFSPLLHRLDQVIRWRATQDTGNIPDPYPILTKYSTPPPDLISTLEPQLKTLKQAAKLEKVPPKAKARRQRPTTNPISGLDIASILQPASHIDPKNSIPSFERMVDPPSLSSPNAPAPDPDRITKAAQGLGKVIENRIRESFGTSGYDRAIEEMGHLRQRLDELEEPEMWNGWVKSLKSRIAPGGELEERIEFWVKVRSANLGLLFVEPRRVSGVSDEEIEEAKTVFKDESRAFWALR